MTANDAKCACEIKSRIAMAKAAFNKKKTLAMLWKVDQKYLDSFEMWCWRRMEKISWADHVGNEEVLQRVTEERNILQTIKRRKANWTGHILHWNCRLKHITEGKIEGRTEVMGM
jgi:hypothetical protein